MDSELKTYLEGMEARILKHVDARIDAMEARIDATEERIMERVEGLIGASEARIMERVDGRIDAVEDRMKLHVSRSCEEVTTKLLSEFWKWGRTSEMRTRQALDNIAAVNERLMNVEDRISALERRGAA